MSERILTKRRLLAVASAVPVLSAFASAQAQAPQDVVLTNVSYDPTRELYKAINEAFAKHWKASTGQKVTVARVHGGSGKQARAVIDGLEADVVTLALADDIDAIAAQVEAASRRTGRRGCRTTARPTPRPSCSWCARATRRASRTGTTWSSRASQVITPNPKTSGGARWNYLAAWAYALDKQPTATRRRRSEFVDALYQERAGARHRRARLDHDLRPARHRRRAARLGERGLPDR